MEEGFFTAVRINPLFPIYPDKTITKIAYKSNLRGLQLFEYAKEKRLKVLPIFDFNLIKNIITTFEQAPSKTKGKHTIIVGFARMPFACVKWVSEAIGWKSQELKNFFHIKRGNCYFYSTEEIRIYYETIKDLCKRAKIPFSVCYDSEENYKKFRNMWANPKDCCNAIGIIKGFEKGYQSCY